MTDSQAAQIRELRKEGIGYKAIGTTVGLSRDIVRNYCKANNLVGFGPVVGMNLQMDMDEGRACKLCGKSITQKPGTRPRKFCSDTCRRDWWKANQECLNKREASTYLVFCKKCGVEFQSYGNAKRKYCSHNCYIKDRFWEDEENGI